MSLVQNSYHKTHRRECYHAPVSCCLLRYHAAFLQEVASLDSGLQSLLAMDISLFFLTL